jgi:hypothetical protein
MVAWHYQHRAWLSNPAGGQDVRDNSVLLMVLFIRASPMTDAEVHTHHSLICLNMRHMYVLFYRQEYMTSI